MALWTVHSKRGARGDDIRLVRDGFRFWALLFPLPWLLIKGMWTAFLLAFAAQILIIASLPLARMSASMMTLIADFVAQSHRRDRGIDDHALDAGAARLSRSRRRSAAIGRAEAEYRYLQRTSAGVRAYS